jgi:hypothetical protein
MASRKSTERRNVMKKELVSFNQELINFDIADLSVEELERRLELTTIQPECCSNVCPNLKTCTTFCSPSA